MPTALSQAFYDITQLLESAEGSENPRGASVRAATFGRAVRALRGPARLARKRAAADCGAGHAAARTRRARRADTCAVSPARRAAARRRRRHAERGHAPSRAVDRAGQSHRRAVRRPPRGGYDEQHLRLLSVVAAELAAYFSMLQAFQREEARAEELAQAQRTVEAAGRAKDEFLALVSHELRTPLNSILVWADALRSKETSDGDRKRAVEAIERAVQTQAKLVADLLDLACIAAATLRLDLRAVDPAHVIREAILTLQPQAKQKAITLDVRLDESLAPLIADPHRLSQVVVALVTNAIKFSPSGGHVGVRLERAGGLARIRVTDSGAGINAQVLPKLFQPFSQLDASSTRAQAGLGVGLALVKDLVELHGGSVHAESAGEERGATFTVELPLGGVVEAAAGQPADVVLALEQRRAQLDGIRVLIVDDDSDIVEVLQFVLEAQGALVLGGALGGGRAGGANPVDASTCCSATWPCRAAAATT